MEAIEHPPIFRLPGIPDHVTYTWLVMVILAALTFAASRNLQLVPRGLQNFLEVVLEQFQQMIDDVMGPEGRRYLPLIATLGLFILTGNLMSLVPGLAGPTSNLNTNGACALIVFLAYHWIGAPASHQAAAANAATAAHVSSVTRVVSSLGVIEFPVGAAHRSKEVDESRRDPEAQPDQQEPGRRSQQAVRVVAPDEPDDRGHHQHEPDRGEFPERFPGSLIPGRRHVKKDTSTMTPSEQAIGSG